MIFLFVFLFLIGSSLIGIGSKESKHIKIDIGILLNILATIILYIFLWT